MISLQSKTVYIHSMSVLNLGTKWIAVSLG